MEFLVALQFLSLTVVTIGVKGQEPSATTPTGQTTSTATTGSGNSGLRRSGRFQCQEQLEDIERLQRQGQVQCRCPTIYAPVCGSDGETYHNRCFLTCAATHKYHRFATSPLTLESWGPCPTIINDTHNTTTTS